MHRLGTSFKIFCTMLSDITVRNDSLHNVVSGKAYTYVERNLISTNYHGQKLKWHLNDHQKPVALV